VQAADRDLRAGRVAAAVPSVRAHRLKNSSVMM
jgi:hypothetical protein